jgi:hypothetical protein
VRETLDIWPPLPIALQYYGNEMWDVDNILAALEHNDRICQINLFDIPRSQMEKILAAMQQPFPELTSLHLRPRREKATIVPASFLVGSAPRLQTLMLNCFPFPGLPKLLLSVTHLVHLSLWQIPHSGYFHPS